MARRGRPPKTQEELQSAEIARLELARANELIDLANILADARVRAFLYRMIGQSGMFADPFSLNNSQLSRNVGFSAMGRALYAEITEASPEAWILMQQEDLERRRAAAAMQAAEAEARAALASEE